MTVYYDELKPGMSESYTKQVSEHDVELFGGISGDMNPVHFDQAYARKTIFRGRVAHGAITVSYVSALLGTKLPGPGTAVFSLTTRFKAPVRIGDTVTAICTVREVLPKRRVVFDFVCKVGETVVMEGETLVMAPARP
jgi:3-hydroxybutyryl-CoA dehydratase